MYSDSAEGTAVTPQRLLILAAVIFLAEAVIAVFLYKQRPNVPTDASQARYFGGIQVAVPVLENASMVTLSPETSAEELKKFLNADGAFNPEMIRTYADSSIPVVKN
ncbi:MAG: hypothetical protein WC790_01405 [Candidatus Paceibacterota bacterium]|jgi:hypothetical protein